MKTLYTILVTAVTVEQVLDSLIDERGIIIALGNAGTYAALFIMIYMMINNAYKRAGSNHR